MAIERTVVDQLIQAVEDFSGAIKTVTASGSRVMAIDDLTIVLSPDGTLDALVFECIGRDFSITKEHLLSVLERDDLGDSEVYLIEDPAKEKFFQMYLQWRIGVISKLSV